MSSPGLSVPDYAFIRELARESAGIVIEQGKEYLVETRLGPLAAREGFASLEAFVASLRAQPRNGQHRRAVEAMTINETSFFRDIRPFDVLKQVVLPEVIARNAATRQLNIWSAACSSGQEPLRPGDAPARTLSPARRLDGAHLRTTSPRNRCSSAPRAVAMGNWRSIAVCRRRC